MTAYRVLTPLVMPEGVVLPGAVVELDDARGGILVRRRVVERVTEDPPRGADIIPGVPMHVPTHGGDMAAITPEPPRPVRKRKAK